MNKQTAMGAYKSLGLQGRIEEASSHELIAMLLQGALQKLNEAKLHMQSSNIAAAVTSLPKQGNLKSTLAAGSAKQLIAQMKAKKASKEKAVSE